MKIFSFIMVYNMENVRPKKHLGQHFLKDQSVAGRIVNSLTGHGEYEHIIEVGPGTGVLTQILLSENKFTWWGVEVDTESIAFLRQKFPEAGNRIIEQDFLASDLSAIIHTPKLAVIGNFPYNISSQILFKVLENKDKVTEMVGMFQKEVAQRVVAGPGGRVNGILSILCQAFYDVDYLFEVDPGVFHPPPKVKSAVIRFRRNDLESLACDEKKFFRVVKTAFNQRRKTLRNSLKVSGIQWEEYDITDLSGKRAEELTVQQFVQITKAAR